jgi:hypothetical protein
MNPKDLADALRRLPAEERIWLLIFAQTGLLPDHWVQDQTESPSRPLAELVAALEAGGRLKPVEAALVERVVEAVPTSAGDRRARRDRLIRETVKRFGPRHASVNARVTWLDRQMRLFVGGADWRATRHEVACPIADPLRAHLWHLAKLGDLPKARTLADILTP